MALSSVTATTPTTCGVSSTSFTPVNLKLPQRGALKNDNIGFVAFGKPSHMHQKVRSTRSIQAGSSLQTCAPSGFGKASSQLNGKHQLNNAGRTLSSLLICAAALNARCGAEGQTQTMEKPVSVISSAPGKEKSPLLDDGGTGFPPRDDDGDGGGGGGGGGNYSGGFFFFGFLALLGLFKDKESEDSYQD